jgi:hypothetical protein
MKYTLTIEFTAGLLKGLTHTSVVSFYVKPKTVIKKAIGGGSYKVLSCTRA